MLRFKKPVGSEIKPLKINRLLNDFEMIKFAGKNHYSFSGVMQSSSFK
jgi:hypothetical protein